VLVAPDHLALMIFKHQLLKALRTDDALALHVMYFPITLVRRFFPAEGPTALFDPRLALWLSDGRQAEFFPGMTVGDLLEVMAGLCAHHAPALSELVRYLPPLPAPSAIRSFSSAPLAALDRLLTELASIAHVSTETGTVSLSRVGFLPALHTNLNASVLSRLPPRTFYC
jgi:hypothetical protein